MKIDLHEVTVRDLVDGYKDDGAEGVVGYGGLLDIRPPYQRNFIYNDKQRNAVIDTIQRGFPLNVMYWSDRGNKTYEIIDGQQRSVSVAKYVNNEFSLNQLYFHNLPKDQQGHILDYRLMVYVCDGTDSEKLKWFETINIAGAELTRQELRNAVYAGPWVTDAKRYFSRPGCPAVRLGKDYMKGSWNRQDYLETAIKWHSEGGKIEEYMANMQHQHTAVNLWNYFQSAIAWIKATFTTYRKCMNRVDWGPLYNEYGEIDLDPVAIEGEVHELVDDDDVQGKAGIYPYVLTRDERHLNIRRFSQSTRQKVYERQERTCMSCRHCFDIYHMEADHIKPWSQGGKTTEDNCQMLCKDCNRRKSDK